MVRSKFFGFVISIALSREIPRAFARCCSVSLFIVAMIPSVQLKVNRGEPLSSNFMCLENFPIFALDPAI